MIRFLLKGGVVVELLEPIGWSIIIGQYLNFFKEEK